MTASDRTTKNIAEECFSCEKRPFNVQRVLLRCPDRKATITRQSYRYILSRLQRRISTHIFGTLNAPTTCKFFVRALKKRPKRLFSYQYILGGHPPGQNTQGSVVPPTYTVQFSTIKACLSDPQGHCRIFVCPSVLQK
jgi:hypothetical protein